MRKTTSAWIIARRRSKSGFFLISYAIHLNLAIDHHRRNHASACRRMFPEVLFEYLIERSKIPGIVEPNAASHDVLRAISGFLQNRENILNSLMRLGNNPAFDHFAIFHRRLA